jgi:hypothetical protein
VDQGLTIHYHGTPITPKAVFEQITGRHYCVSHAHPQDIVRADEYGQTLMLDNGAFTKWKTGKATDWNAYYEWTDQWLRRPTTWAVIPDDIEGDAEVQDALIAQWPHGQRGAPVWHMHEPIDRLLRLIDEWPRVCVGSSSEYSVVGSPSWRARMDIAWIQINRLHNRTPWIHMLRGMQCAKWEYPFASVDSADIGRNHARSKLGARGMADRWDAMQCPPRWTVLEELLS